jgi:hypothetical protein
MVMQIECLLTRYIESSSLGVLRWRKGAHFSMTGVQLALLPISDWQ